MAGHPLPLNPLSWYKKLATKKGRLATGVFLVEGQRAIAQIRHRQPDAIQELLTTTDQPQIDWPYPQRCLTPSQIRSISSTKTPQGMVAVVRLPMQTYEHRLPSSCGPKLLFLEDIQDPGNVGTLIRTAAAFQFTGALLTEKCADPFAPKCVQASAGTVLSLWLRRTAQSFGLVSQLQQQGYALVAATLAGQSDPTILSGQARLILALGNEGAGLSLAVCQAAQEYFTIPMDRAGCESLNVATSGAICMYLSTLRDLRTGLQGAVSGSFAREE
jgi:TrmH family RNA methyltransferase